MNKSVSPTSTYAHKSQTVTTTKAMTRDFEHFSTSMCARRDQYGSIHNSFETSEAIEELHPILVAYHKRANLILNQIEKNTENKVTSNHTSLDEDCSVIPLEEVDIE
jgi:hypothetical protein